MEGARSDAVDTDVVETRDWKSLVASWGVLGLEVEPAYAGEGLAHGQGVGV